MEMKFQLIFKKDTTEWKVYFTLTETGNKKSFSSFNQKYFD